MENRKREPKSETRCGCLARFVVRFVAYTGRWHVALFVESHNHDCLDPRLVGFLPTHRKMAEADASQMNNMKDAGISTPHIYAMLANQAGGYENVNYTLRDMYNEIARRRRHVLGDARAALRYLKNQKSEDTNLYYEHIVDAKGVLRALFWCDGRSQLDYEVFGDVLAFDATYKKNKYLCPVVVFSGVNHHNQTVVFGSALVTDESKEVYVWLLQQLLAAMKGKAPVSVITDGAPSMRFAIETVFPNAHHRLCAWHLIRNATSNVGNPKFTSMFKKCMLGDYEISVFEQKWFGMVEEFGVAEKNWIIDMYEKRHMWATAHIRGKFFAGFRTTSRCEGLHSIIAKYVKSQYNLVDFIKHFKRCLTYLRYKEVEADYVSISGLPVLKTALEPLERSASNFYTREIFFIFRGMLVRAARMKVVQDVAFDSFVLYTISKYGSLNSSWEVSVDNERTKFNCSCLRMDSFGIPCEHIVCVLVFLNILELPKSLVLTRWSKNAKTSTFDSSGVTWESIILSQYGCLMDWCRQLSYVASRRQERFHLVRDTVMSLIEDFKIEDEQEKQVGAEADYSDGIFPKNPQNCRSKCRPGEKVKRKPQRCSICRMEGHNKKSCPLAKDIQQQTNATSYGINRNHVEEGLDADAEMEFWASDLEEDYEEQEFWAGDSDASADMELSEEFSM
ncbi:Protein FAR1-RELATED SEQUENCE [Arachis hypogaea]|nr:Protein FAR1-RELATED SEQUENCE [Arachis hypogaea]